MLWCEYFILYVICAIGSLSWWLYWEEVCAIQVIDEYVCVCGQCDGLFYNNKLCI